MADEIGQGDARPTRRVADSLTVATRMVMPSDINGFDWLFGGRLMAWIDEAAGICGRRHSGCRITTACVDTLTFRHPVRITDIIEVVARVTFVGRTSLEVRVDTFVDEPAGAKRLVNSAYLTEVCIDDTGHPVPCPYGLELVSDDEREEWEGARSRREIRRGRAEEGV